MTREAARDYINGLLAHELQKAPKRIGGHDSYVCPFCGNGSGPDGTGISTRDGKRFTCFKGCFSSWDYLDILKRKFGVESETDIFTQYNINIGQNPRQEVKSSIMAKEAREYLQGRGISPEVAERFGLGYDPHWRSPTAVKAGKNPPASRRLIIPTGAGYTARTIDADTAPAYRFMKEGPAGYFNAPALYGSAPAFITESAIDALSVCEVGGVAVALGSTSGVDRFLRALTQERPTVPLILSLDNDEAGQKAQAKLKAGLEALGVLVYELNISGTFNDPNELLTADRAAFTALVHSDPAQIASSEADSEKARYIATSAAHHVAFLRETVSTECIPTGFKALDAALDDGLYEGLYIIGAVSSLGKTTFVLQMADQIAARGRDVLIFSLEMSRYELMAKSVSRLTFEMADNPFNAKSARAILSGAKRRQWNRAEHDLVSRAMAAYEAFGGRIYIHEGIGTIGADEVKHEIARHISFTGNTPVVIIDYLQILAPHDMRATDKQNTDRAVLELKRLTRDRKLPLVAVSSFNRDNYTAPVNLASFKESGAIEYSCDVLLGLQLAGMDNKADHKTIEDLKKADPRRAQLKILKNRNGRVGLSLYYDYHPVFNCFLEGETYVEGGRR